jgi:hypothetical protein
MKLATLSTDLRLRAHWAATPHTEDKDTSQIPHDDALRRSPSILFHKAFYGWLLVLCFGLSASTTTAQSRWVDGYVRPFDNNINLSCVV